MNMNDTDSFITSHEEDGCRPQRPSVSELVGSGVPFQHKYGYIRDERSQFIEDTVELSVTCPGLSP